MAAGTISNVQAFNKFVHTGMMEREAQMLPAFNAASGGTITLVKESITGNYLHQSIWDDINDATRRVDTSVSAATDAVLSQDQMIHVKLKRGVTHAITSDAVINAGSSMEAMGLQLGRKFAEKKMKDMLHAGLVAAVAAIEGTAGTVVDRTAVTADHLTHAALLAGNRLFGDRAPEIAAYVMDSTPWHDLIGQVIADNILNITNITVNGGSPGTLGRRSIVTDDAALTDTTTSSTVDIYSVLGLVPGAIVIKDAEADRVFFDEISGLDNLIHRFQGEFAFTVGLKGYQWDTTNGGANPTDTALGTGSNWDIIAGDNKNTLGVSILVNAEV